MFGSENFPIAWHAVDEAASPRLLNLSAIGEAFRRIGRGKPFAGVSDGRRGANAWTEPAVQQSGRSMWTSAITGYMNTKRGEAPA